MSQNAPQHPSLQRAYKAFIEELTKQVKEAERLSCLKNPDESFDLNALQVGFHKIKGGAGFFGLSEIAAIARDIERLLARVERIAQHQARFFELVAALGRETSKLGENADDEQKKD